MEDRIHIALGKQEALILFDWLVRQDEAESLRLLFEDPVEQQVLWKLEGKLEKVLDEIFAPNYREILLAAREEIRDMPSEE